MGVGGLALLYPRARKCFVVIPAKPGLQALVRFPRIGGMRHRDFRTLFSLNRVIRGNLQTTNDRSKAVNKSSFKTKFHCPRWRHQSPFPGTTNEQ